MRKLMAGVAILVMLLGGALTGIVPAQAAPPVGGEPRPPAANRAWEKAAKAKPVQGWQYADKGYPDPKMKVGGTRRKFTPRPGVTALAPPPGATVYRNYHIVRETVAAPVDGLIADLTIADPYLNFASEYHGVLQLAFQDSDGNAVEVGWTVNPVLCPSEPAGSAPCVFTYSWEGGVGQGYGVDFVPAAGADYAPGDLLPNPNDSSGLNFRIIELANEIWVGAGDPASAGYWMGYHLKTQWTDPGTDATAPFTQATLVQAFTETASTEPINATWNTSTPCSDSGNGYTATSPNGGTQAARIVNVKTTTGGGAIATAATPTWLNDPATIPAQAGGVFPMQTPATNNFRVGGPGWKGNNTLPGVRGGCG